MHDAAGATGRLLAALGPGPGRMRLPLSCRLGGTGPPPGLLRRASPQSRPSGLLSGHRDTPKVSIRQSMRCRVGTRSMMTGSAVGMGRCR